jgi:hypothetical protein
MNLSTTFKAQLARVGEFLPLSRRQLKKMGIPGSVATFTGVVDFDIEPSPDWTGETAIASARKMVRTDTQIRGLLNALKLPILAAGQTVEPASDESKDIEIAEFVQQNYFENPNFTFQEVLRHVLMYMEFGAEVLGKEFEVRDGRLWLKRFVHIKPEAITDWHIVNGELLGIEYLSSGDDGSRSQRVLLTADQIFHIANEQEGANFQGQSILRSAWPNFVIKDMLLRTDAINHERWGSPTPVGEMDNDTLKSTIEKVLKDFRSNAKGYIAKTRDWDLKQFPESGGKQTGTDVIKSIEYHDKQMTGSVVADFLTIGRSNVGSFAMNASKQDFFMMALGAHFDLIEGIFNRGSGPMQHVKQLVDLNFGIPSNGYPKLLFVRPTLDDAQEFAATISSLIDKGAIKMRTGDEQFMRQRVGMRELSPEEEAEALKEFEEEEEVEDGEFVEV